MTLDASAVAALIFSSFQRRNLLLVDENLEIAGKSEVDLRGKESRRQHLVLFLCRQISERESQQRAADAIADHVYLFFSRQLLDRLDRGERAFVHVVLEGFRRQFHIGIDPGDDKHGESLIDAPLDERFLRREIENVKFIDPWRDDQQGRLSTVGVVGSYWMS